MTKRFFLLIAILPLFTGCYIQSEKEGIMSIQLLDRNGFSETISNSDRLHIYEKVDFLTAQPYENVLRVYKKNDEGKSPSKLTSYHSSGGIWQYLEAIDGRANGRYLQWHENGKLHIQGKVVEGIADLSPMGQKSWLFDGICTIWDEEGNREALFIYERGKLTQNAQYFYPDGKLKRIIPYVQGLVEGKMQSLDQEGLVIEEIEFTRGVPDGNAFAKWRARGPYQYEEFYKKGKIIDAVYFNSKGELLAKIENGTGVRAKFSSGKLTRLSDYKHGKLEGEVRSFDLEGHLLTICHIKDGKKMGEEWDYYPPLMPIQKPVLDPSLPSIGHPKLLINWFEDQIQGMVKTWYPNGTLQSQREMSNNKKHGLTFGYYKSGDLMLMEEYEDDLLVKGSYYKQGEKHPVSTIEKGEGTATLYNGEGHFQSKISYERGKPSL